MSDLTHVLNAVAKGKLAASKEFFPLVYDELRRLVAARMQQGFQNQPLQATALVYEVWLQQTRAGNRT